MSNTNIEIKNEAELYLEYNKHHKSNLVSFLKLHTETDHEDMNPVCTNGKMNVRALLVEIMHVDQIIKELKEYI